jgi:hypothetical protein
MSFLSNIGSLLGWFQGPAQPSGTFIPRYRDVCQARAMLKALSLPTEIVLQILDDAQYWPQHSFISNFEKRKFAAAQGSSPSHAALCLDADIFNNPTVNPIRKSGETLKIKSLEFDCVSRDQGWTSENTQGTFHTSSWLEVSILRSIDEDNLRLPDPRIINTRLSDPSDFHKSITDQGWVLVKRPDSARQGPQDGEGDFAWYLQGNRVAVGRDEYRVIWAEDGSEGNEGAGSGEGFLQELKDGDRILVWARAKVCINLPNSLLGMS